MEKWVDCYFYPEYYQVSSLGRVRSKDRISKNSRGNSTRLWKGRIITPTIDSKKRYLLAKLFVKGKRDTILVHRLVAYAFLKGDINLTVNHKNGIKTDNRIENLEIVSLKENAQHAKNTGLLRTPKGSASGNAKIDEEKAKIIKKLHKEKLNYQQIADKVGATAKIVGDICRGRTWNHV